MYLKMNNIQVMIEQWLFIPRALFRLAFILLNNAYCIPTYVVWMILLSPLKKINPDTFWRIEGYFFHWLLAMVSMWSWSAGYDVVEVGDDITNCLESRTLVIANHQSTGDVPLLMACFNAKKGVLPNIMWIMDSLFKYTNFGVVSVLHQDFFIKSGKANRNKSLQELMEHIAEAYIPRGRLWMVLFPEGGFLRKRRAISQKYAKQNNLPVLNHVSLPRVGALQTIISAVGPGKPQSTTQKDSSELTCVLDITIAYPNGNPIDLKSIIFGHRPPCKTVFFYRLYPCTDIPTADEEMTTWLYDRFVEKERMLAEFYQTGRFPVEAYCKQPTQPHVVAQDCLRFLILHLFFITSTYVHWQMFTAAYNCIYYIVN